MANAAHTTPGDATFADPTLLETLRALTPEERLRWNDRAAATVLELRHSLLTLLALRQAQGERSAVPETRIGRLPPLPSLR